MSESKKEEKKADLSEAEKTAVGGEIHGELIDDVITSDTTQPSVPGIVLDTINDIIMGEVALAKEEAAKEKEEKEKEEEKQKKEQEKKKEEEEKKKKKQPASPPPLVTPVPKSPSSPKSTYNSQTSRTTKCDSRKTRNRDTGSQNRRATGRRSAAQA